MKPITKLSTIITTTSICFLAYSLLCAQKNLALTFNGTPPFSAGENFTVTATISGAEVASGEMFRIRVECASCQGTTIQTCDITAMGSGPFEGSCSTANFTAPTGSFYGFQVNGTCTPVMSFSSCTGGSVLPVELAGFVASYANDQVELKWQTLSELNNDRFEVEHSRDGYHFQKVGTVEGEGTTAEAKSYFYFHRMSIGGTHYYRLKQIDTDGTFDYSNVVGVIVDNGGKLSIYPNPVKDVIYVQQDGLDGNSHFQLMDALGRKLNTSLSGNAGFYEINLPKNLPRGTYWLKVERAGKVQTLPVVKE